jgi:hypothetical protein
VSPFFSRHDHRRRRIQILLLEFRDDLPQCAIEIGNRGADLRTRREARIEIAAARRNQCLLRHAQRLEVGAE